VSCTKQALPTSPVPEDTLLPQGVGFLLTDMEDHQCRWPIGIDEYGKHLFCGSAKRSASSYCDEHHKLAWIPGEPFERIFGRAPWADDFDHVRALSEEADEYLTSELQSDELRNRYDDDPNQWL
jgi:hypothetical protein